MQEQKLIAVLSDEFKKSGEEFKVFLWRDKLGEILETQKRFVRLVEWIGRQIEICGLSISINAPMNRDESYTKGDMATYLEGVQRFAVLVHSRELLLDANTSGEQRKNIEYTLEKLYGVHYDEYLEDYV